MTKFIRLLNFEFNRIYKFLIGIGIFVFFVQLGIVMLQAFIYKWDVVDKNLREGMSANEIIGNYGLFSSYYYTYQPMFLLPIGVGATAIFFYTFFIWYRDWLGKNTFIYRLLMLPISRMHVYFAKLTTILLSVLGLAMMQYLFLYVYRMVVTLILPTIYRTDLLPAEAVKYSSMAGFLPTGILLFIFAYAVGTLCVMLFFTLVLLERSYRLKGVIIGICYIAGVFFITFGSFFIQLFLFNQPYFYPGELVIIYLVMWIVLMILTFIWDRKLMKQKITV